MRVRTTIRPKGSKTVDPVLGQHLLNGSWLAASFGCATLQLRLLAQALPALQSSGASGCLGTGIAALVLVWLLGTRLGRACARRCSSLCWGAWLLAGALCWLLEPALRLNPALPWPPGLLQLVATGLLAAMLSLFSAAWLARERPWPTVGEGTEQVADMSAVLVGLVLTWRLPDWSGAVGCLLLLPLLLLDLCPAALCPHPRPGSPRQPFLSRPPALGGSVESYSTRRVLPLPERAGWCWLWLARRGHLSQTLLGGGMILTCLSVWSVLPTLYALGLAKAHDLDALFWLLGGQMAAYLVGMAASLTRNGLRVFRASALPMAPSVRRLAISVEWSAPGTVALALAALGNPWQQASWFLALALFCYTLALGAWKRVHARLAQEPASEAAVQGPRFFPWVARAADAQDLAGLRRQRDDLARRGVARWEVAWLVVAIVLTGALSDAWGVGPVFMLAGCVLVANLGAALIAMSSTRPPSQLLVEHAQRIGWGISAPQDSVPRAGATSDLLHSDALVSSAGERDTTAQHALLTPQRAGDHSGHEGVWDYAPLALTPEEDGEGGGRGNNHPLY